ncbi:MAG: manganese efflux pump MntP family protein [Tangfeifania sp.]
MQLSEMMEITDIITYLLIGIGLSFDSFAVSVSCGLMRQEIRFIQAALIAFSLAFFQAGFPVIGWLLESTLNDLIAYWDHWIAFLLLALVGVKMMTESKKTDSSLQKFNPFKITVVLGLSVATSIDAMVVGLSFGLLELQIWLAVVIIGAVTFIVSMLGMLFGKYIPAKRIRQSLFLGGIILTTIGIKILIEHLWF